MEKICSECEGGGKIIKQFNGMWDWHLVDCPTCKGKGFIGTNKTPFGFLIAAFAIFAFLIFKCCG